MSVILSAASFVRGLKNRELVTRASFVAKIKDPKSSDDDGDDENTSPSKISKDPKAKRSHKIILERDYANSKRSSFLLLSFLSGSFPRCAES